MDRLKPARRGGIGHEGLKKVGVSKLTSGSLVFVIKR